MHRIRFVAATGLFAALLFVLAPGIATAAPAGWWVGRVIPQRAGLAFSNPPCVTDKLVAAFSDNTGNVSQLWVWQNGAASPSLLATAYSTDPYGNWGASGGRIAWWQGAPDPEVGLLRRVMTWEIGDAKPRELARGGDYSSISVSGDRVMWNDATTGHLYTWKKGDSHVTTIGLEPFGNAPLHPSVSGDRIVYEQSDGSNYQIVLWQAGAGEPAAITTSALWHIYPTIDGTRIAWIDDHLGYDVRTMAIGGTASVDLGVASYPQVLVSGDRLAWIPAGTGSTQLMTWTPGGSVPTTVTAPFHYVSVGNGIGLSGNRFAWLDGGGSSGQIITKLASDATASVIATDATWNMFYLRLAGDTLGWLSTNAAQRGIWVAHKQVSAKITTPYASPSKPTHGRYFYIKGGLGSSDPAGGKVSLRVERYYSRKWHFVTTLNATLAAGAKTYSYKAKMTRAGKYRVRASHVADFAHLSGTSTWKTFAVK